MMRKVNLYCFPFAGGSRFSYQEYIKNAPSFLNVIPLEIPGRGVRSNENACTDLVEVAEDAFNQIKENLHEPYFIYGHSMGGLLGYLVTKKIIQEKLNQPLQLFFTGCVGPSVQYRSEVDYRLPKAQFLDQIKNLGGSSNDVLSDQALMGYFEPILRADFEAVATYNYQETTPFDIPISVIIGVDENATYEEAMAWQKETTQPVDVQNMEGNHFFITGREKQILSIMLNKLETQLLQE